MKRISYIDRKSRTNVRIRFEDSGKTRLQHKRKWKFGRKDKRIIKHLDKLKLK